MSLLSGDMSDRRNKGFAAKLHIDLPLLAGLLVLMGFGLMVLYSASGGSELQLRAQIIRLVVAFGAMIFFAWDSSASLSKMDTTYFYGWYYYADRRSFSGRSW